MHLPKFLTATTLLLTTSANFLDQCVECTITAGGLKPPGDPTLDCFCPKVPGDASSLTHATLSLKNHIGYNEEGRLYWSNEDVDTSFMKNCSDFHGCFALNGQPSVANFTVDCGRPQTIDLNLYIDNKAGSLGWS